MSEIATYAWLAFGAGFLFGVGLLIGCFVTVVVLEKLLNAMMK